MPLVPTRATASLSVCHLLSQFWFQCFGVCVSSLLASHKGGVQTSVTLGTGAYGRGGHIGPHQEKVRDPIRSVDGLAVWSTDRLVTLPQTRGKSERTGVSGLVEGNTPRVIVPAREVVLVFDPGLAED